MKKKPTIGRLDSFGGIIIPKPIRRQLHLKDWDSLEITADNDVVIIEKVDSRCVFCSNEKDTIRIYGKSICKSCADALSEAGR